jgi:hypothetical protein
MVVLQGTGVTIIGAGGSKESDRIIINAKTMIADKIIAVFWARESGSCAGGGVSILIKTSTGVT